MIDRLILYFTNFFVHLENWGAILMDPVLLACLMIAVHDRKTNPISLGRGILRLMLLWSVTLVLKGLRYQTLFNIMFVYLGVMLFYSLVGGRRNYWKNLVCLMLIWSFYVMFTTNVKALAGVIVEDFMHLQMSASMVQLAVVVLLLPVFGAALMLIKRFPLEELGSLSVMGVIFVAGICLLSSGAKVVIDTLVDNTQPLTITQLDSRLLVLFVGLLLYVLACVAYVYCYNATVRLRSNEHLASDVQRLLAGSSELENQKEIMESNMEELRAIKHDLKNQMAYMQIMLAQKDYDRLEQYLADYNRDVSGALQMPDCDNPVVRNVLILEMQKARRASLSLDARIAMEKTSVSDTDLIAVLLNLLDNAIEACVEDGISGQSISCHIRQAEAYLFITVINPVQDEHKAARRRMLLTPKDANLHGRGTRIVRSIAEKYAGTVTYTLENNQFIANVMLGLTAQQ